MIYSEIQYLISAFDPFRKIDPSYSSCYCHPDLKPIFAMVSTKTSTPGASSSTGPTITANEGTTTRTNNNETEASRVKQCPVVLVVGMAGSGKTTLVDAFSAWLEESDDEEEEELEQNERESEARVEGCTNEMNNNTSSRPNVDETSENLPGEGCYVVNLDPAVTSLPYEPNVDIRDTISYKDVMREYSLGPNGGILTSLNLYATRFDQVLELIEKRSKTHRAIVIDTPGQIETFTWSASGQIITDALAQCLATVIVFVLDVPRALNAMTFVSSMLYACSIMYKTRLPMVIVLNKCDAGDGKVIETWMRDYDAFDQAMNEHSMAGVLANSIALGLEEFYKVVKTVHVTAVDGIGMNELSSAIDEAVKIYNDEYKPWLEEKKRIASEVEDKRQTDEMERVKNDLRSDLSKGRMNSFMPIDEESAKEAEEKEERERIDREARENADPAEKEAFEALMRAANALNMNDRNGD